MATVYSKEIHDIIVDEVKKGNKLSTAAKYAGISPRTLSRWLADDQYEQLKTDIEKAEAVNEGDIVSALNQMMYDDSKAAQYLLDKRYGWDKAASQILEKTVQILEEICTDEHQYIIEGFLAEVASGAFE
jgi:transcriptional regulator with XRE-family HTH domain